MFLPVAPSGTTRKLSVPETRMPYLPLAEALMPVPSAMKIPTPPVSSTVRVASSAPSRTRRAFCSNVRNPLLRLITGTLQILFCSNASLTITFPPETSIKPSSRVILSRINISLQSSFNRAPPSPVILKLLPSWDRRIYSSALFKVNVSVAEAPEISFNNMTSTEALSTVPAFGR